MDNINDILIDQKRVATRKSKLYIKLNKDLTSSKCKCSNNTWFSLLIF